MRFKQLVVGEYDTNCYIVYSDKLHEALVIDPAFELNKIEELLGDYKLTNIILTHGHIDHIYEAPVLKAKYGAKIFCGIGDREVLKDRSLYAPYGILPQCENREYEIDRYLEDGEVFDFGEYSFEVLSLKGHTPGGIGLLCDGILFSGDVLFYRSYGRTDFPTGDDDEMLRSLNRLSRLNPETKVYPGHGLSTSIKYEKENNYFMKKAEIYNDFS